MTTTIGGQDRAIIDWSVSPGSTFYVRVVAGDSENVHLSPWLSVESDRMSAEAERASAVRMARVRMRRMAKRAQVNSAASPQYADRPASIAEDEGLMPGLQKLQASALAED